MKRFVWRLQRVLDIKAKQEQLKRIELFQLAEKLTQKHTELLMRQKMLQDIIAGIARNEPQKRLTQQELFLKYSATNDRQIKQLKKELLELESQQKRKIAELLEIRRFKEGLEKLRAEAKRQFIEEQEKLEQKELDERAVVSFARKMDLITHADAD